MVRTGVSVTTDNLSREFGATVALDGVDIDIRDPEIIGLAGPNGSGKTTLIRCLLGLLAPTAGTCAINGVPSLELGPGERGRIGFMPQREAVYADLTARENVSFFARLYDLPDRTAAVERALSFVELTDRVLFLRDGRVLAMDTPEVFLRSTGTDDLEDAFLELLEAR